MPTTLYYNPRGDDTGHRHQANLDGDYDIEDEYNCEVAAELCAKHWHDERDGLEGEWPRVFSLYRDKTGPAFARFEVQREYEPQFSAVKC